MIRTFDILLATLALFIFSPLIIFIYFLIYLENKSPIFKQVRVGKNMTKFTLLKFRTMKIGTESRATHLTDNTKITKIGALLRNTKLDELPQLFNVLKGDMSLVGPRPCLLNQFELISLREESKVFLVKPGITGLAQIKGIDMSNPKKLALTDSYMISKYNQINYFKYLFLTLFGRGMGDKIKY